MRLHVVVLASLLISAQASADMQSARFALHRKAAPQFPTNLCDNPSTPTVEPNYSPNYDQIPCSEYTVNAPLEWSTVYIVLGQAGTEGVGAVQFGVDYDGRVDQHSGIDPQFVSWQLCSDGFMFTNDGGFGHFPAPKGGARITWTLAGCPKEVIGSHGVHAVIGAMYVYAYSEDLLRVAPYNNAGTPELSVFDCSHVTETDLLNLVPPVPVGLLLGRVQIGEGSGGFTPCFRNTTGVGDALPTADRLHQNSPNPFQGATRAAFDLAEAGQVTLKVFDLNGREVRVLADDWYPAGTHEVNWNARDAAGRPAAEGIYFLHIQAGSFTEAKRMYLQR